MAEGAKFEAANTVFGPPRGATEKEVSSIPAYVGADGLVVTCWKFTEEELAEIARTGRVFVGLQTGGKLPPHWVAALEPFEYGQEGAASD